MRPQFREQTGTGTEFPLPSLLFLELMSVIQEMHMRWIICLAACLLFRPLVADAQVPQFEVYGGYAYTRVDSGGLSNITDFNSKNWNGWEASFASNFTRHFGVAFDFSGDYGSNFPVSFAGFAPRVREQAPYLYAYLAGPQFLLPLGRVMVFGHAMAGATQMKRGFTSAGFAASRSDTAFGSAVGGGIDVSLARNVALRIVQADYLMSKNFGVAENNLRVSGGIVFQFGSR